MNLVIDPRLGDKANKSVTLKLDDVSVETAVYLLAEVADLATVRLNNVLFVTTPEGAKQLEPHAERPTPAKQQWSHSVRRGRGAAVDGGPIPVPPAVDGAKVDPPRARSGDAARPAPHRRSPPKQARHPPETTPRLDSTHTGPEPAEVSPRFADAKTNPPPWGGADFSAGGLPLSRDAAGGVCYAL